MIEIKGISKKFKNHVALDNIDLSIPEGSIYGLLGHNGAGKTTLIRILTKIIMADSGTVSYRGNPLSTSHLQRIGYLPEERGLYKKMRVKEQLLYLAQLKDVPKKQALVAIDDWTTKFGLEDKLNNELGSLSKGMQQKVQFIATVINQPEFVILDEPFSGFDPLNVELIKKEILNLKLNGTTILYSTHRMDSVDELCDNLAIINQSKKVLDGNIVALKKSLSENKFIVRHAKPFAKNSELKPVSIYNEKTSLYESTIEHDGTTTELLKNLPEGLDIDSFNKLTPSVEDLFFKYVKQTNE